MEVQDYYFGHPDNPLYHKENLFMRFLAQNPDTSDLSLPDQLRYFREKGINGQTYFFRTRQEMELFRDFVLPTYQKDKDVSVASVGCSRGKEAYTLLLLCWHEKDRLNITGYDSDNDILLAHHGFYYLVGGDYSGVERSNFHNIAPTREHPAFALRKGAAERLFFSEEAKEKIKFRTHDILEEPLPEKHDVVFLMNVLMHYSPEGRERILYEVSKSLTPGGWLILEKTGTKGMGHDEYYRWNRNLEFLGFKRVGLSSSDQEWSKNVSDFTRFFKKTDSLDEILLEPCISEDIIIPTIEQEFSVPSKSRKEYLL